MEDHGALDMNVDQGIKYILNSVNTNHIDYDIAYLERLITNGITDNDTEQFTLQLSEALLSHKLVKTVYIAFKPLILDLVVRWRPSSDYERIETYLHSLSLILPLEPQLLPHAIFVFKSSPSIFTRQEQHLINGRICQPSQEFTLYLQDLLLSCYRLLFSYRERFRTLWSWTPLYHLLHYEDRAVRYLALRCLAYVNSWSERITNAAISKWIPCHEQAILIDFYGKSLDLAFLSLVENERMISWNNACDSRDYYFGTSRIRLTNAHLSAYTANLTGVLAIRSQIPTQNKVHFVLTTSTTTSLNQLARALLNAKPILITGPSSCGKTTLVESICNDLRDDLPIKIHLGDQSDAKVLLGSYVSSSNIPGSFEWKDGVLTNAVKSGRWILIEDIDLASTEVLSVLIPLLEQRKLYISGRGESIPAHVDFKLFATQSTSRKTARDILGEKLYTQIHMPHLNTEDIIQILESRFPKLEPIIKDLIEIYDDILKTLTRNTRIITFRDLIKWCARICDASKGPVITWISPELREIVVREALDLFFGANADNISWRENATQLLNKLGFGSVKELDVLIDAHKPSISMVSNNQVSIGRVHLPIRQRKKLGSTRPFAMTGHSLRVLERIGVAVHMAEPLLLVGETGTGKTTVVQQLAMLLGQSLHVVNLSQQSESSDLLGGFKPVDATAFALPLHETFEDLFTCTFSAEKNTKFIQAARRHFNRKDWTKWIQLMKESQKQAAKKINKVVTEKTSFASPRKKRRVDMSLEEEWSSFSNGISSFEVQHQQIRGKFVFKFIEGTLVKAMVRGDWILLDEINLASPETLEQLSGILQGSDSSLVLVERGDVEPIKRHPNFRIFACMNPASDVGKRDLPPGIRSRFTELYVHSPDSNRDDLLAIVKQYIGKCLGRDDLAANDVVEFYLHVKQLSDSHLLADGANQRPHFSLRTLSRALVFVSDIMPLYGLRRSLYEGLSMMFLTILNEPSQSIVLSLIRKHAFNRVPDVEGLLRQLPKKPQGEYAQFGHIWLELGPETMINDSRYIMTPSVEAKLFNLARVVMTRKNPVLIQGPTSTGKTSMVEYLAKRTGHRFVRINNHEHTDLQEYLGSYVSNDEGRLEFKEGVLVQALRNGHWIVLDELNLAPTDVLEALNRLLDDNRELFIPETQEVVKPHSHFMLFATQNPPGLYGGRKILSRAFRNRFVELHFDDLPQNELETILSRRCDIAPSYCSKIVAVYEELIRQRQSTRLFEQKHSFATLRDLFRWANREAIGYEQLARNGYMLLAERVRKVEEKKVVRDVIEKIMKVKVNEDSYYQLPEQLENLSSAPVWTKAMRRLYVLTEQAILNNEPVLLVGETGCGKTTLCQILAEIHRKELVIVNCHQNTETGDLIGAQRPVRNRAAQNEILRRELVAYFSVPEDTSLDTLIARLEKENFPNTNLLERSRKARSLFEWVDGPLISSMRKGCFFLLDEISLADDSVLERLNSVLEPARLVVLAEKADQPNLDIEELYGHKGFQFLATMNPGSDYGKKELSPALRNRFTEIWVDTISDRSDLFMILENRLEPRLSNYASRIIEFSEWFMEASRNVGRWNFSLRDLLSWVHFMNKVIGHMDGEDAYYHGACLVLLDGLGMNSPFASLGQVKELQLQATEFISRQIGRQLNLVSQIEIVDEADVFRVDGFTVAKGNLIPSNIAFNLSAPATSKNVLRIIRAMQLSKPILLEGSPGVGKTSLVSALANATGHALVRINLSEQTDLMDLFGSDLPIEGGKAGEFAWKDAPFLIAMQSGQWVLLDELNLASQSVLEGLNSCLDHRATAYIPELDREFQCHSEFRVFAAQNPLQQGGGRKGLPKSFVNRFTQVYMEELSVEDLMYICMTQYPNIDSEKITKIIEYNQKVHEEIVVKKTFGNKGAPWEFNLRDIIKWLELMNRKHPLHQGSPLEFFNLIYIQRFRTEEDRAKALNIFNSVFSTALTIPKFCFFDFNEQYIQIGNSILPRQKLLFYNDQRHKLVRRRTVAMEAVMKAIEMNWLVIVYGATSTGKTSLIRTVAEITGTKLEEFSMNAGVDTLELLGGFDQVEVRRHENDLCSHLGDLCRKYLAQRISTGEDSTILGENINALRGPNCNYHKVITELQNIASSDELQAVAQKLNFVNDLRARSTAGKFEWVDGVLIRAVDEGDWLLIDNANLCNPSVLDRLNSLFEPNGFLLLNERGLVNEQVKKVSPHPNFRMIMTINPKYGELSRAMRNRAVEIALLDELQEDDFHDSSVNFDESTVSKIHLHRVDEDVISSENILAHVSEPDLPLIYRYISQFANDGSDYLTFFIEKCLKTNALKRTHWNIPELQLPLVSNLNPYVSMDHTQANIHHFQLLCYAIRQLYRLQKVRSTVGTKSLKQMTVIEQALVHADGSLKIHKPPHALIQMLGRLLIRIPVSLYKWLQGGEIIGDVTQIHDIIDFWEDLYSMPQRATPDFSRLAVILGEVKSMVEKPGLSSDLANVLTSSINLLDLKVFAFMNCLWNYYRPDFQVYYHHYTIFQELEEVQTKILHWNPDLKRLFIQAFALLAANRNGDNVSLKRISSDLERVVSLESGKDEPAGSQLVSLKSRLFDVALAHASLSRSALEMPNKLERLLKLDLYTSRLPSEILSIQRLAHISEVQGDEEIRNRILIEHDADWLRFLFQSKDGSLSAVATLRFRMQRAVTSYLEEVQKSAPIHALDAIREDLPEIMGAVCSFEAALDPIEALRQRVIQFGSDLLDALFSQENSDSFKKLRTLWQAESPDFVTHFRDLDKQLFKDSIFEQVLEKLRDSRLVLGKDAAMALVSEALIVISRYMIELYIPDVPFDPSITAQVGAERKTARISRLSHELEVHRSLERRFTGNDRNIFVDLLSELLQGSADPLEPVAMVLRPEGTARISEIFQHFYHIKNEICGHQRIESLVQSILGKAEDAKAREVVFQETTTQGISRMRKAFPMYRDLFEPLQYALLHLKLGVRSLLGSVDLELDQRADHLLLCTPTPLYNMRRILPDLQKERGRSFYTTILLLAAKRIVKEFCDQCVDERNARVSLNAIADEFGFIWSKLQEDKAKQEAEKESLYKTKTVKMETEEEIIERELVEMFPDYVNSFNDDRNEMEINNIPDVIDDNTLYEFMLLFKSLCQQGQKSDELHANSLCQLEDLLKVSQDELPDPSSHAVILAATQRHFDFLHDQAQPLGVHDFYRSSNLSEIRKVILPLRSLKTRLLDIANVWPEQMILDELAQICESILTLPLSSPIAKVLTGLELLLQRSEDWERVASREFSISSHRDEIVSIIISWRRLELLSWSQLLDTEDQNERQKVAQYFFHLHRSLVVDEDSKVDVSHVVQVLDQFFQGGPRGQFEARLDLVKAFASHVKVLNPQSRVHNAIVNVVRYYSEFLPFIKDSIHGMRKPIEQDLKNFIKLASWKDINVYALRESAKRTHRQLHKAIRKFKDGLQMPVLLLLQSFENAETTLQSMRTVNECLTSTIPDLELSKVVQETFSNRASRLEQLSSTLTKMRQIIISDIEKSHVWSLPETFSVYSRDILDLVKGLQNETPTELTDENKKKIKLLKQIKKKALVDTMKDLQRLGLSPFLKPETVNKQADLTSYIFQLQPAHRFDSSDSYYYQIVRKMLMVRNFPAQHSPDLSPTEIQRGVGICENLLRQIIAEREVLFQLQPVVDRLRSNLTWIRSVVESGDSPAAESQAILRDQLSKCIERQSRLSASLQEIDQCLDIQYKDVANRLVSDDLQDIRSIKDEAGQIARKLQAHNMSDFAIHGSSLLNIFQEQREFVGRIVEKINDIQKRIPALDYLLSPLKNWMSGELSDMISSSNDKLIGLPGQSVQDIELSVCQFFDSILVTVQELRSATESSRIDSLSEEIPDKHFAFIFQKHDETIKALHLKAVETTLSNAVQKMKLHLESFKPNQDAVFTLLSQMYPFLSHYNHLAGRVFEGYFNQYSHLCSFTLNMINIFAFIAKNGFCQPAGSEDDGEGSGDEEGNLQNGGLGDGDGSRDVSNKIEDEDEALGNQDQDQIPQETGTKEERNAMDMEQDFEGNMEDYDVPEDKDENQADEEEKSPEEQIGPIDDLDPDTVDEKLWGDESIDQQEKDEKKLDEDRSKKQTGASELVAKEEDESIGMKHETQTDVDMSREEEQAEEDTNAIDEESDVGEDTEETEHRDNLGQKMDVPDPEFLDLPEDLNLEGSDGNEENTGDHENPDEIDDIDMAEDIDPEDNQKSSKEEEYDVDNTEFPDQELQQDELTDDIEEQQELRTDNAINEDSADQEPQSTEPNQNHNRNEFADEGGTGDNANTVEEVDRNDHLQSGGINGKNGQDSAESQLETPDEERRNAEEMLPSKQEGDPDAREDAGKGSNTQTQSGDGSKEKQRDVDLNPLIDQRATMEQWTRRLKELLESSRDQAESAKDIIREDNEFEYSRNDEKAEDELALAPANAPVDETKERAIDDERSQEDLVGDVAIEDTDQVDDAEDELMHEPTDIVNGAMEGAKDAIVGKQNHSNNIHQQDADFDVESNSLDQNDDGNLIEDITKPLHEAFKVDQIINEDEARSLWRQYEGQTHELSMQLTEQLRLILEPTMATKLRGDYRTGKRLNMKKIIPYIASDFKRDKIWLRRTKPSKRQYQVMIALDDSRSMSESGSVPLAYETLALVSKALTKLEVGEISVVGFGEDLQVMHGFDSPFTDEAGVQVISKFGFRSRKTDVRLLVERSLALFKEAREISSGGRRDDLWQLELIISDGICENHAALQALIRRAYEEKVMFVFIVVDALSKDGNSILTMNRASYQKVEGKMTLKMERYLDTFPFDYHVVVRDVHGLPEVLSTVLREWFSQMRDT